MSKIVNTFSKANMSQVSNAMPSHRPTKPSYPPALVWMHIGDLHLTEAELPNHLALKEIIQQANTNLINAIDFVVLPGDNTDDGTPAQYQLLQSALSALKLPLHILPGDHDFKSRRLDAFYDLPGSQPLPHALTVKSCRCIFLDFVSPGSGGPDFRLGATQLAWLADELDEATGLGLDIALFGHAYPDDLTDATETKTLVNLIQRHRVRVMDMGHTHYNELANDGQTIYATTRSTGQIEEGPVGFSIVALDQGVVSWRFKPLATRWPLVMITSPADRRLTTQPAEQDHKQYYHTVVRAQAWSSAGIAALNCRINDDPWIAMHFIEVQRCWELACEIPVGQFSIVVRATDNSGQCDQDAIEVAAFTKQPKSVFADGSDRDSIGSWPEQHIFGTQLGPNRNGQQW